MLANAKGKKSPSIIGQMFQSLYEAITTIVLAIVGFAIAVLFIILLVD